MRAPSSGLPINEIGEFELINSIKAATWQPRRGELTVDIGDDAAVWKPRPGRQIVATTDMMVENVDFRSAWTEWQNLGHKALAINLSDIAAMGAWPRIAIVSLGLRGTERDREIVDLYRGINGLAHEFHVRIAGGDVSSSPHSAVISITVIGETGPAGQPILRRSAARPGDVLAVTGSLGLAAAGLRVLEENLLVLDGNPAMRERFEKPIPRVREGRLLARAGVRAAMDISDGLLGDLPKLCAQSNVSAIVDLVRLPIPNAIKWAFTDWFDLALRGGEDFELLFTASPGTFERVCRLFARVGLRLPTRIGEIVEPSAEGPGVRMRKANGLLEDVEPGAFSHFKRTA